MVEGHTQDKRSLYLEDFILDMNGVDVEIPRGFYCSEEHCSLTKDIISPASLKVSIGLDSHTL